MRTSALLAAALIAIGVSAHAATQPLLVTFQNNSGQPTSNVYIGFVGPDGSQFIATNAATGESLQLTQYQSEHWYYLSSLPSGIKLGKFTGGRIYVGYGEPWHLQSKGYEPDPANSGAPDYLKRFDKVELTYNPAPADVADLTSIDYFSIPMTLNVYKGGVSTTPIASVKGGPTATITAAVGKVTTPAKAAIVTNPAGNSFVRAIGPGKYPPPSAYSSFSNYLAYLQATWAPAHGGVVATVAGQFAGVGANPTTPETKPQKYEFTAKLNSTKTLTISGSGKLVGQHTITITAANLNAPTGIYGANPTFTLDGGKPGTPQNDIYGWIIGDMFAGLNVGAVGSTTSVNGKVVGTMPSQQWTTLKQFFAALQPANPRFMNRWAAALAPITQAYAFAYSDRFPATQVVVTLNPAKVDTLQIVFLSDKAPSKGRQSGAALTERLVQ